MKPKKGEIFKDQENHTNYIIVDIAWHCNPGDIEDNEQIIILYQEIDGDKILGPIHSRFLDDFQNKVKTKEIDPIKPISKEKFNELIVKIAELMSDYGLKEYYNEDFNSLRYSIAKSHLEDWHNYPIIGLLEHTEWWKHPLRKKTSVKVD